MNVAHKTKQSFIWYTSVPFFIHLLRFANSILLARILSPSDFGIMGIVTVILYYCDSYSDFGFGRAIIQRNIISDHHYVSYFSFNIIVSMLFFMGVQGLSDWLSDYYQIDELADAVRVSSLLFFITAFSAGPRIKLQRDLNFKPLAIIEGLKVGCSMAISLTLALRGYGFWSLIYAMLLSHAAGLIALFYVSRLMPRFSYNLTPLKDLFHFGLWDFAGAQFKLIGDSADKLIIGKVLGTDSLGFYDKALGLARMPNDNISIRLSQISFSSFSRIRGDNSQLESYFFKVEILNATIVLPLLVGLIWVSESFILILFGEKWLPMVPSLQIFSISYVFTILTNPIVAMNQAATQVKYQTLIRIISTILLVFSLVQTSPYGIEFAALSVLMFNIIMFIASYTLLNTHLKFGWYKLAASLSPVGVLVISMVLALSTFDYYSSLDTGVWHLTLTVGIGGLSYSLLFIMIPFKKLAFLRNRILRRLGFDAQSKINQET